MLLESILLEEMPDHGPVYFETNLHHFIVEPWNMVSASVFIFIAIYWILRLQNRWKTHPFLRIASPILLIGGVGGTLYHGFRESEVMLMMDWMPILILTLMAGIYFMRLQVSSWGKVLFWIMIFFALETITWMFLSGRMANNISYALMAGLVLIPTALILRTKARSLGIWVIFAGVSFALALLFRILDPEGLLPMGTHFLWHLFGALACHLMFKFVYLLEEQLYNSESAQIRIN